MWRDLFSLSKREQFAFLSLIIVLFLLILFYFIPFEKDALPIDAELQGWIDSVEHIEKQEQVSKVYEVFSFNPNIVKVKELERLGFSQKAIINLIKYREAGGHFVIPDELANIYGLDSNLYQQLKPYITFDSNELTKGDRTTYSRKRKDYSVDLNRVDSSTLVDWSLNDSIILDVFDKRKKFYFKNKLSKSTLLQYDYETWRISIDTMLMPKNTKQVNESVFRIELNSADTAMLTLLRGIGPVLSKRIVSYRNKIGGFYNINQLQEVSGISPIVLKDNSEVISVDTSLIHPLDIGKASLRRMKEHPYLNFYMAKEIYEARKERELHSISQFLSHEAFKNVDGELLERYFVVLE